jgi:CubicO group peptidase (beta-lactamase class C family)
MHRAIQLMLITLLCLTSCSSPTSISSPTTISESNSTEMLPGSLNTDKLASFENYAIEMMQLAEIPGMAIAVVQHGEVIYAKGFGVRELGKNDSVTPDTLMMIGSVSKAVTAVMMATIVDDGLVQWDTPVTSILPTFATGDSELTAQLTMRHMVCACSGMPGKDAALFLAGYDHAEDMIRGLQYVQPVSNLEQEFNYSNTMFASGGYIATLAAGGPPDNLDAGYIMAMQERVFDPVDMAHTTLSLDLVQNSGNYALPHGMDLANHYQPMPLATERFVLGIKPAGAIWSNANDMSRLLITLINQGITPDGQRIVSNENLNQTWEPGVKIAGGDAPMYYGLGWIIEDFVGRRIIHHSGGSMGFSTEFSFQPESGIGIVIMTNAESAGDFAYSLRSRLFELAFDQPFEHSEDFRRALESNRQGVLDFSAKLQSNNDENVLSPYLGTYSNPEIGEINLLMQAGKFRLHTNGLDSELRRISGLSGTIFTVFEIPLVTLGQLTFQFKLDSKGEPIIVLREKMVSEPYIFEKANNP